VLKNSLGPNPGTDRHEQSQLVLTALENLPRRRAAQLLLEAAERHPATRQRILAALAGVRESPEANLPASVAPREAEPIGDGEFMIGSSPPMLDVFEKLRRYAPVQSPVLITGESGTGKELAARAIHERSNRAGGPFVAINCAALPPSLISSELFGHEKGAFTGAVERRIGHIEQAHQGTLFLDEIGDLPLEIQGHLLRFLQDGHLIRLGGRQPLLMDVRIVAATHVSLFDAVTARRFREDLFYRLAVLTLEMPPLRARGDDIDLLATIFLRRICAECGRTGVAFTPDALAAMRRYAWPGNVRQMIAIIRRAVVMGDGGSIGAADLAIEQPTPGSTTATAQRRRPVAGSAEERNLVLETLQAQDHCVAASARALGVSRVTFYRMLARHGIALSR
jgi:DNA-binding NtrC family response regulator